MQIDESRKLLLSDTLVPDIFITELLPGLSGLAVKLYVYILLVARTRRNISEQELARRLGAVEDDIRAATLELATHDLVQIRDRGLEILDIKAAEIEKAYRPKTASSPLEAIAAQGQNPAREKLLADISKTFFQGLMSPSWYSEIDTWFERFRFDPEVIYALFQECARRNKLNSKAYITKVAENWSARGITSFADLNAYFMSYDKVSKASKKIGRKLHRQMTEYDEEMVGRWVETLGYDFDIIELALRKTTRSANPNMDFVDRVLNEWFAHQLRDPEAVKAYEADKAARHSAAAAGKDRASGTGAQKARNIGNFEQREYSAGYFEQFYEEVGTPTPELPAAPPDPETEWPGQIGFADLLGTPPEQPPADPQSLERR